MANGYKNNLGAIDRVFVQTKNEIWSEIPTLQVLNGRGFMPRFYGKVFLFSLVIFVSLISSVNAAQFFAGRWHNAGESSSAIGIIQYGETVAILSEAGWAMTLLVPETGGMLASGEGKWNLSKTASVIVNITIGYRDNRVYLRIVPKDRDGFAEYKIIMERIEPSLPIEGYADFRRASLDPAPASGSKIIPR